MGDGDLKRGPSRGRSVLKGLTGDMRYLGLQADYAIWRKPVKAFVTAAYNALRYMSPLVILYP
jgi:hypothetical protein